MDDNLEVIHYNTWLRKHDLTWLYNSSMAAIHHKLDTYYKFLVTRHPFDRLISAYVEKLVVDNFTDPHPVINSLYEFLDIISLTSTEMTSAMANMTSSEREKFRKFVYNEHWTSQVALCHPCVIDYDYIAKIETLDIDQLEILPHFGASSLHNLNSNRNGSANYTVAEYHDMFGLYAGIGRLRDMFKLDFEAFDYDSDRSRGSGCEVDPESPSCC